MQVTVVLEIGVAGTIPAREIAGHRDVSRAPVPR